MAQTTDLQTEITISDLKLIASLIDLATNKGILRAADLTLIGGVYDKIVNVIKSTPANEN